MSDLKFNCPHCDQPLEAPEQMLGQVVPCPSCQGQVQLPEPEPPAEPARPTPAVPTPSTSSPEPPPTDEPPAEDEIFLITPCAKAFIGRIIWGAILVPLVIGIFILVGVWYRTIATKYRLTSQRFIVRRGLIARRVEELELYRIKDVSMQQGMIQRLLNYGSVLILSTDDSSPRILLEGISNPFQIKEQIRTRYRMARKTERIRAAELIES